MALEFEFAPRLNSLNTNRKHANCQIFTCCQHKLNLTSFPHSKACFVFSCVPGLFILKKKLFPKVDNLRWCYKVIVFICFYIENQHNFITSQICILEVILLKSSSHLNKISSL
jgi:hypothetical protein